MASVVEISEYLRAKMVSMAVLRQSLTHPDVVQLSQRLDTYILQAQNVLADGTEDSTHGFKESFSGLTLKPDGEMSRATAAFATGRTLNLKPRSKSHLGRGR